MLYSGLNEEQILQLIPQQKPFRFIDSIVLLSQDGISGIYTFKPDEFFYEGHFPGNPVTPGVILLECMCQIGVVAFGIYLLSLELPPDEIKNWLTLFSDAEVEFIKPVHPGEQVTVTSEKLFWRRMKLRSKIEMRDANQNLIATATASGMGIKI